LLVPVIGLSIFVGTLIFSESLETAAIATVILSPATAVLLETRRRRAVWSRWQSQQKHRSRFSERTRRNGGASNDEQPPPWWQVLEIPKQATVEDVKSAYRAKIKQFHPDTIVGLAKEFQELAERKTKEINRAYRQACRGSIDETRQNEQ
jgi:DnaJ-domain-containing protein 1